jgi:hypothetical protein
LYRKSLTNHKSDSTFNRHVRASLKVIFVLFFILLVIGFIGALLEQDQKHNESNETTNPTPIESAKLKQEPIQTEEDVTPSVTKQELKEELKKLELDFAIKLKHLRDRIVADKNKPKEVFILWRLNEWEPEVNKSRQYYDNYIEKHRADMVRLGGLDLPLSYSAMTDLSLAGLYVTYYFRDNDEVHLKQFERHFNEGTAKLKRGFEVLDQAD